MVLLLTLPLAMVACGPKQATVQAPVSSAETSRGGPEIPSDATSQAFARELLKLQVRDWSPTDPGGVNFRYLELTHKTDNTWSAKAMIGSDEESMECVESGKWSMEPAVAENTAMVMWDIQQTTCPGREPGKQIRGKMEIREDGTFRVAIH